MSCRKVIVPLLLLAAPIVSPALTIQFDLGPGFTGQPAAEAALHRAAAQWTTALSDPILATITTDFMDLGAPNIIGGASSVTLQTTDGGFNFVRDQIVADGADESDNAIVAALPNLSQLSVNLPNGFTYNNEIAGTKANFKALEFPGLDLDADFGASDGTVLFNSQFAFDFDQDNGVGNGLMDFETVAAHEIGHILGFTSMLDDLNGLSAQPVPLMILDLFRFNLANQPTMASEFTTFARELRPGQDAVLSDLTNAFRVSTGLTGDGRQASHFRDDALSGELLGIMDPTLAFGTAYDVTAADLRALDLIGYEYTSAAVVPIPAAWTLLASGLVLLQRRKGR